MFALQENWIFRIEILQGFWIKLLGWVYACKRYGEA